MKGRSLFVAFAVVALPALTLADATIEQKTRFEIAGPAGKVVNFFSKSAREGVTTTTALKGDRKMERTGDHGELIDLGEEKVYHVNFARQSYTVETFEEIRRKMREAMEEAKKDAPKGQAPQEQEQQYEVDFDVKETGRKEAINGFDTRQVILTVTVRKKGMTLEKGGGAVLTSDMWLGPQLAALEEEAAFDLRYAKALALHEMLDQAQMQALAAAFAANPALQEAMRKFRERKVDMKGSPVRAIVSMEAVADPQAAGAGEGGGAGEAEAGDAGGSPRGIGGMLGKLGSRIGKGKQKNAEEPAQPAAPGRSKVFSTTTEILRAEPGAPAEAVAIPSGFKQKGS